MNPLELDQRDIADWTPAVQAIAMIGNCHFDVFNAMERATKRRDRSRYQKALGTLWRAAEYIRLTSEDHFHAQETL